MQEIYFQRIVLRSDRDSNSGTGCAGYTLSSSGSRRFCKLIINVLMFSIFVGANVAQTRILFDLYYMILY